MSSSASHVVIDSKYRTNSNDFPHNFTINLQNPITNFKSIDLISVFLPNGYFNVSETRKNSSININGITFTIPDGNYNITEYVEAFTNLTLPSQGVTVEIPLIYNNPRVTIFKTSASFSIDFTLPDTITTAYTLGFQPRLYTGGYYYYAHIPPSMSPLGILIDVNSISRFVSATNSNIRMATYVIPNNTNQNEYINFYESSGYSSTIDSQKTMSNSLNIQVRDTLGHYLHGLGDWIMILKFNR
jgi:hypothetical protein